MIRWKAANDFARPLDMIRHACTGERQLRVAYSESRPRGQECPRHTGLPQVGVGFIDPVGAGGLKMSRSTVSASASAECGMLGGMVRTSPAHYNLFAVDPELQRAFQDVGDLLVVVAVFGHDASFLEQDAGEHDVLPDNEVAAKQGVQDFDFDF